MNMRLAWLLVPLLSSVCGDSDDDCEGSDDVCGCLGGWVEFSCSSSQTKGFSVLTPKKRTMIGEWSSAGTNLWPYQSTTGSVWTVLVRTLSPTDFGKYECSDGTKWKIKQKQVCGGLVQMPEAGAETTLSCPEGTDVICKDTGTRCKVQAHGRVHHIHKVSLQDQGVYWCGRSERHHGISMHIFHAQDELLKTLIIVVVVCTAVLLLALVTPGVHKKMRGFRNNLQAQTEEGRYEEIEERPPQSDAGTTLTSVYAFATAPAVCGPPHEETFRDNVLYSPAPARD